MTREELIGVNAGIVKSVAENILKYSPNAILVVISNPMDTMTYLSLKALGYMVKWEPAKRPSSKLFAKN